MSISVHPGSFRDDAGFLYTKDGILYRQINACAAEDFSLLKKSGLLDSLHQRGWLIPHEDVGVYYAADADVHAVIKPTIVPYISYPAEWCFSQLKDAALLTLDCMILALNYGMILKDASAYNVQFVAGKPVFIDTLSFERYSEGMQWVGYGQFCRHFLAPLALMSYTDIRLNRLCINYLDGIPLDLAQRLLPFRARFRFGLLMHLFFHAAVQRPWVENAARLSLAQHARRISKTGLMGTITSLRSTVKNLQWKPSGTQWCNYYDNTNYTERAFTAKHDVVACLLKKIKPQTVADLGSNDGTFSTLAAQLGSRVISFDSDPAAVEKAYVRYKNSGESKILPLFLDITNPTPAMGWNNAERSTVVDRGHADAILALALLHHLVIACNIRFAMIAALFARTSLWSIIEFVPPEDSQVQRMMSTHQDAAAEYNRTVFIREFRKYFDVIEEIPINESCRSILLMKRKAL